MSSPGPGEPGLVVTPSMSMPGWSSDELSPEDPGPGAGAISSEGLGEPEAVVSPSISMPGVSVGALPVGPGSLPGPSPGPAEGPEEGDSEEAGPVGSVETSPFSSKEISGPPGPGSTEGSEVGSEEGSELGTEEEWEGADEGVEETGGVTGLEAF